MDLELERLQLCGFEAVLDTTLSKEETLEMIVPDACPDILRVVDTGGTVLLSRREAMDGSVELAGVFKLTVLYLPDGESGVRHLDVSFPFTCSAEGQGITADCSVTASARLCRADTRALNPRKVLVRAEAVLDVTVFSPKTDNICSRLPDDKAQGLEQLTETQEICLTACVQEKPFQCTEEISLPASRPTPVEILGCRVGLTRGDAKIIGNKLIFKGSANVTVLCRGEDDSLYTAATELPFSQIMEVSGVGEEAECELNFSVTGLNRALDESDPRIIAVSVELLAQAVVRETRRIEILADAYSTKEPLEAEWETRTVERCLERGVRSQSARDSRELTVPMREVVDCRGAVGVVTKSREGEKLILTAQVEVEVLYLSEEGALCSIIHPMTVPCALDIPESALCFCRCELVGDVYVSAAMGGMELRLSMDFQYCALARRPLTALSDLRAGEPQEHSGAQPSLVLRMLERGERLWDVAKAYGTTIADIISANELEDEAHAVGCLLLIPRRR